MGKTNHNCLSYKNPKNISYQKMDEYNQKYW